MRFSKVMTAVAVMAAMTLAAVPLAAAEEEAPPCGNPYLSILPTECDPDYEYWDAVIEAGGQEHAARMAGPSARLIGYSEIEVGTGATNDTQATAEFIAGFGTGTGDDFEADVSGDRDSAGDDDFYSFALKAGDILGANVTGAAGMLELYEPGTTLLHGSDSDASFLYSTGSTLPGGGNAVLSYVIDTPGVHAIKVSSGVGAYTLELRVFRPVLESRTNAHQILFIDFDGATIPDRTIFSSGPAGPGTLSALDTFLAGWGLVAADEDAVIDAIMATVHENFADIAIAGANGDRDTSGVPGEFKIDIRNSRDHANPWGQPNVARVIVGGTIAELGISTIGIAQSIDVGNFTPEQTAVTLLDLRSAPSPDSNSLNSVPLDPSATIIELIGISIGNTTAHEAGHFFANWHVDRSNAIVDVMDKGGDATTAKPSLGPDGIFGTADDIDRDFGSDAYSPLEGFTGTENTMNAISFGLSTGPMYCNGLEATHIGTAGPDVLTGTAAADVMVGLGGADVMFGGTGADTMCGGSGADKLFGEGGPDDLFGGNGNDTLVGGDGQDELFGQAGKDRLLGGGADDTLVGGAAADLIWGGSGDDTATGGDGPDNIRGGGGDDSLTGNGGADTLFGGPGTDELFGGPGGDTCTGEILHSC